MMNTKDLSNMNTAEKTEGLSQVLACLRIQAMANAVI